ncbi:uncharacterized protein LOC112341311, partial [Selaginella moellendorffii]|uniref:uncharacterized protein LOC112341311 n=1 Tax=Selaginella moellendorffii TaxID=88036 RepID=UPI000D1C8470
CHQQESSSCRMLGFDGEHQPAIHSITRSCVFFAWKPSNHPGSHACWVWVAPLPAHSYDVSPRTATRILDKKLQLLKFLAEVSVANMLRALAILVAISAALRGSADAARERNQLQSLTRIGGAQSGKQHLQARSRNREKLLSVEKRLLPKTAASLSGRNHIRNLSARRTLELLELAPPAVPSESKRLVPTGPDPLHHSTRTETLHPRQPLA